MQRLSACAPSYKAFRKLCGCAALYINQSVSITGPKPDHLKTCRAKKAAVNCGQVLEETPFNTRLTDGHHISDLIVYVNRFEFHLWNRLCGWDTDFDVQTYRGRWGEHKRNRCRFRTKTQAEWCALPKGVDARSFPSFPDKGAEPSALHSARHVHPFIDVGGVMQPAPERR